MQSDSSADPKKGVLHILGAVRLEPYKMYGSNRTAHVICTVTAPHSCTNCMRF
ncbi:unnamed protein product, partial [Staurois parvus]